MINITKNEIEAMERIARLTLINSITGYKPANVIGTRTIDDKTNLAIISSVIHLGSDPALIGFVMRPLVGERHTMENILATGKYTINHIHAGIAERAHFTSADFPRHISEFDSCKLTPEYLFDFDAPYVMESRIKIGLTLVEKVDLAINKTILVIGQVEHIIMLENYILGDNSINFNAAGTLCISGLDTYHHVHKMASYPYARPDNLPDFNI
jgi:flavin reductase (DIM6/NTAB) family NADH-FMN oxidoreductase RutF